MTIGHAIHETATLVRRAVNMIVHGLFGRVPPGKRAPERGEEDTVFQTKTAQARATSLKGQEGDCDNDQSI
jgi:hypothetical protein